MIGQGHFDAAYQRAQEIQDRIDSQKSTGLLMGKGGSTITEVSGLSLSSNYLAKSTTSRSSIGVPHIATQFRWNLGIALAARKDPKLTHLVGEFGCYGCVMCQGFGHSKSDCLTYLQLKMLTKNQALYGTIHKKAMQAIQIVNGVYNEKWLYGDLVGIACANQRKDAADHNLEEGSENLISLCDVFSNEMSTLKAKRCEYCDGFGHLGEDQVTVKLGKRTRIPPYAKRQTYGRHEFISYHDRCNTKYKLEIAMLGFNSSIAAFNACMGEQRTKASKDQEKKRIAKLTLNNSLQDIVSFVSTSILNQTVQKQSATATTDIQTKALKFEEEAKQNMEIIKKLPQSMEQYQAQMKTYQESVDNLTYNVISVSQKTTTDQRLNHIVLVAKQWNVSDKFDEQEQPITVKDWDTKLSTFPFFFYTLGAANKKGAKGNKYPLVPTVCMLISWLIENRTGFTGIPEEFEIPDDEDALKNFALTFALNEIRPLQAICVSKKAYEQALALYYHLKSGLLKSNPKADIATSLGADEITADLVHNYTHVTKPYEYKGKWIEPFSYYKDIIDSIAAEALTEETKRQKEVQDQLDALHHNQ